MATHLQFTVQQTPIRLYAHEPKLLPGEKHPAIVLLHGAGGNLDFWVTRLAPFLAQAGIALYAPHYFDSTGTSYADLATITDGHHAPRWMETVDAALRFVADRPGVDADGLVLTGISLGAFLALGLAAQLSAAVEPVSPVRVRALVEISGGLVEPYLAQATPIFPPTLILHGAEDNIVPASEAKALSAKLTQLNVAHRTEILPKEGHWFSHAAMARLLFAVSSFLGDHLAPTGDSQRAL